MSWRLTIFTGLAAFACAVVVFELKGTVRELDRQIDMVGSAITADRWRLQTLKADFAYLTRPERLAMQAAQLGMVPGSTKALARLGDIGLDAQLVFADKTVPVVLPNGVTVDLRFKPAIVAEVAGVPGIAGVVGTASARAPAGAVVTKVAKVAGPAGGPTLIPAARGDKPAAARKTAPAGDLPRSGGARAVEEKAR